NSKITMKHKCEWHTLQTTARVRTLFLGELPQSGTSPAQTIKKADPTLDLLLSRLCTPSGRLGHGA
ncbi:MAG: hypothetical protein OXP12_05910, partial [Thaumarchaeota archaeon]|nr:hypothetical protein [Nitrososphaerota archaeon]